MKNPIMQSIVLTAAVAVLMSVAPSTVFANGSYACIDAFKTPSLRSIPVPTISVAEQAQSGYESDAVNAYKRYSKAETIFAAAALPIEDAALDLLNDEELSTFHRSFATVLRAVSISKAVREASSSEAKKKAIIGLFQSYSARFMSPEKAKERANTLNDAKITKAKLMKALGQLSQVESLELLIGSNGINSVSTESLIGRYLAAAKKVKGAPVATLVSGFSLSPESTMRGDERLFISVDAQTVGIADKLVASNTNYMLHNHERSQGTLSMLFDGQQISYSRFDNKGGIHAYRNTIAPVIALSSLESSYTLNYFTLGKINYKYPKYPWALVKKGETGSEPDSRYCRFGGYASCTHWIGEMPIGEKFVSEYAFPGNNGDDPYSTDAGARIEPNTADLRTAAVGTYTHFSYGGEEEAIGAETRTHRLTRMVWRGNKGHEQLWSLIGDKNARGLAAGEWANPGWVLYSFLARAKSDRVPVVFIFRDDATQPFTQADLDALKSSIYAK